MVSAQHLSTNRNDKSLIAIIWSAPNGLGRKRDLPNRKIDVIDEQNFRKRSSKRSGQPRKHQWITCHLSSKRRRFWQSTASALRVLKNKTDKVGGDVPALKRDKKNAHSVFSNPEIWMANWKMGVKAAYLQGKGFIRKVHVRWLVKKSEHSRLWTLLLLFVWTNRIGHSFATHLIWSVDHSSWPSKVHVECSPILSMKKRIGFYTFYLHERLFFMLKCFRQF